MIRLICYNGTRQAESATKSKHRLIRCPCKMVTCTLMMANQKYIEDVGADVSSVLSVISRPVSCIAVQGTNVGTTTRK